MIKKLQIKFILLTMFSLLLVLLLIVGSINFVNYRRVVTDADSLLTMLMENDGKFPKFNEPHGAALKPMQSPELQYESRYFSVLLQADGAVVRVDTGKISAVDTETAIDYAQSALGSERGFEDEYRYLSRETDEGIFVVFLYCGRSLDTFRSFLLTSGAVSLLGLLAVLLLMLVFSGRIIKPVSESYEKQKRFITDAGHEIKTPLTVIDADAEVLESEIGENEWLADIQKQTKRLAELTNSLISLSRMEEAAIQQIVFPLSDVVSETAQSFQALALTQEKQFEIQVEPLLSFCGDEKALRQLVSILLDNALKYSTEHGKIALSLEKQGRNLRLRVKNDCAALTKENLAHLFDRFYRTDASRNSQTGGYGVGLSIAKAIVEAHKGKITASCEAETALCITVTLPA